MKKRNWFFFSIKIFPLVAFALAVHQQGATDLAQSFGTFITTFRFDMIANVLQDVFSAMSVNVPTFAIDYASWLVLVLLVQIMYEVVVFLPEFARGAFERVVKS